MNKLSLNFFGENAEIDIPKSLNALRQQISEKFLFSPSEAAEIIVSYAKDLGKKIISTEKDFMEFLTNKINKIDLDISQDSQIYQKSLIQLKNEAQQDKKQLDDLLKKSEEIKAKKELKIKSKKKDMEELTKKIKEITQKKKELDDQLKAIKKQQIEMTKKLHQDLKTEIKEENENNTKILELQKKLGLPPICLQAKPLKKCSPHPHIHKKVKVKKGKTIIKKKAQPKKEEPKKEETKPLFDGINDVINKMVDKVNGLVNSQISKENEKVENTEKKLHESQIQLKPEEQKGFLDIKKIGENALTEMNKWTQFVIKHTAELTESLSQKYQECKKMIIPIEEILDDKKEIHYRYICDGCNMKPIRGIRYHCQKCPDFDFCENCYKNKKDEHGHGFTAVEKSVFAAPQQIMCQNQNQTLSDQIIHFGVQCDGCGAYPIVGCRYKCAVCKDFDYCEKCEEKLTATHLHPFIKIYNPSMKIATIKCVVREDCPDYQSGKH